MLKTTLELARPLLFALDPEQAHEVTLRSLEAGLYPRATKPDDPRLGVKLWGMALPNPIGIAAGFDKDARVPDAMLRIGFGFAEIGTVTPRPQAGNPRPRVFRLIGHRAIINRLGFNNGGHDAALRRLQRRPKLGVVGVNIGANKETADRAADYVLGIEAFYEVASYFTVNISSPNTPGLRDLQAPAALDELLGRVMAARERRIAAGGRRVPGGVRRRLRACGPGPPRRRPVGHARTRRDGRRAPGARQRGRGRPAARTVAARTEEGGRQQ